MNRIEAIVALFLGVILVGFIVAIAYWKFRNNLVMQSDYTANIVVDKCEKIPVAVSNVMWRVTSKGFIINKTSIKYSAIKKLYTVTCGGVEEATLLKFER